MLETLMNLDGGFLLFLQEAVRNPVLDRIMIFITSLGNGGMIWIAATVLLLIFKKTRKAGIVSATALICSLLFNNMLIKNIVQRSRPYVTLEELRIIIPRPSEFSFPSGHSSASFAAAVSFYRLLPKKLGIPAVVLAALIAFSRLYVGVHYPTDVLAGALMGTILSYLAQYLVDTVTAKIRNKG